MNHSLRIAFGFALVTAFAPAATWTVDNQPSRPADFRTIQDAIDAASIGDTILVSGSSMSYSDNILLTKKLRIVGPGYFIPENGLGGAESTSAEIGFFQIQDVVDPFDPDFGRSPSGSIIEGLDQSTSQTIISASGVTIRRMNISNLISSGNNNHISRSWIGSIHIQADPNTPNSGNHNLITSSRISSLNSSSEVIGSSVDFCVFENQAGNTFSNPGGTVSVRNSIFISSAGSGSYSGAVFDSCMAIGPFTLSTGNGNTNLASNQLSNVFQLGSLTDKQYVLKAGSAAIGSGKNGASRGMFGGPSPYIISGIPAIPRIKSISLPTLVPDSTGLTFEVQAEARD